MNKEENAHNIPAGFGEALYSHFDGLLVYDGEQYLTSEEFNDKFPEEVILVPWSNSKTSI